MFSEFAAKPCCFLNPEYLCWAFSVTLSHFIFKIPSFFSSSKLDDRKVLKVFSSGSFPSLSPASRTGCSYSDEFNLGISEINSGINIRKANFHSGKNFGFWIFGLKMWILKKWAFGGWRQLWQVLSSLFQRSKPLTGIWLTKIWNLFF